MQNHKNTCRTDIRFSEPEQEFSPLAQLNAKPATPAALAASAELARQLEACDLQSGAKRNTKRGKTLETFTRAVGAICHDLLSATLNHQSAGWLSIKLSAAAASGHHVGYRLRKRIIETLFQLGLIDLSLGRKFVARDPFGGDRPSVKEGRVTRIKATRELIAFFASYGVTPENLNEHFISDLPKRVLYLKASSRRAGRQKIGGKDLSIKYTEHTQTLEAEVRELNEFTAGFSILPCGFNGYHRTFNQGDLPDFHWNKGGRLYADFQQLPSEERAAITINDEPVVEVDVSASYLAIYYGMRGIAFDREIDPYLTPEFPREVGKAFIHQTLGSNGFCKRWSKRQDQAYFERSGARLIGNYSPKAVKEAILKKHPILSDWESQRVTWADLMFAESEAMIGVMIAMMNMWKIPSLIVHDSLIVRQRDMECAIECIELSYQARCKVIPNVRPKSLVISDSLSISLNI